MNKTEWISFLQRERQYKWSNKYDILIADIIEEKYKNAGEIKNEYDRLNIQKKHWWNTPIINENPEEVKKLKTPVYTWKQIEKALKRAYRRNNNTLTSILKSELEEKGESNSKKEN